MTANIDQKIKFTNSHRENFLVTPQSSDKTWEYPPQTDASGAKKKSVSIPCLPLLLQLKLYDLFVLHNIQFIMPALQSPHYGPMHVLPQLRLSWQGPLSPAGHGVAATTAGSKCRGDTSITTTTGCSATITMGCFGTTSMGCPQHHHHQGMLRHQRGLPPPPPPRAVRPPRPGA